MVCFPPKPGCIQHSEFTGFAIPYGPTRLLKLSGDTEVGSSTYSVGLSLVVSETLDGGEKVLERKEK